MHWPLVLLYNFSADASNIYTVYRTELVNVATRLKASPKQL